MQVYSIFKSVNGEVNSHGIGSMTTFLRFSGCTANCRYCDTTYAQDPEVGRKMAVTEIVKEVIKLGCKRVTITGGEPFEQNLEELNHLLKFLHDYGFQVTVETNGVHTFDRRGWPLDYANYVVDVKLFKVFDLQKYLGMRLIERDYLKFVIGCKEDFINALGIKNTLQNHHCKATFAFSPMYGAISANRLVSWMLEYEVNDAVLNFQAHKVLEIIEAK